MIRFLFTLAVPGIIAACAPAGVEVQKRAQPPGPSGCYFFLGDGVPWNLPPQFQLLNARGTVGYERDQLLLRPRSPYNRAFWSSLAPDSLLMIWARVNDDGPSIMIANRVVVRAVLRGDTLTGEAVNHSDLLVIGQQTSRRFQAVRQPCDMGAPETE